MANRRVKLISSLIVSAFFLLAGLIVICFASAYRFSGFLFIGISAAILCYTGLNLLSTNHLTTAKALRLILSSGILVVLLLACVTGAIIHRDAKGNSRIFCPYVVVLGAGVDGTEPSLTLTERLNAAFSYLKQHPHTVAVLSGGKGDGEQISEAECMYRFLTEKGIRPEQLRKEDQAVNTSENIRFSLDLIEQETGIRPSCIGLISNDYHLHRACSLAAGQGIDASGIPAKSTILPLKINYFLREIAAVWYYSIIGG